jgi:hypothetical protein
MRRIENKIHMKLLKLETRKGEIRGILESSRGI